MTLRFGLCCCGALRQAMFRLRGWSFFSDFLAQERFGVLEMGRPQTQCQVGVPGLEGFQKIFVFVPKSRDPGVMGAKQGHKEANLGRYGLKEAAETRRICGRYNCRVEAHVRLRGGLPVLVVFHVGKFLEGGSDPGGVRAFTNTPNGFELDEPADAKDVRDVVPREPANPGTLAAFTDQKAVSYQSLHGNSGGWPGYAQFLGYVGISHFGAGRIVAGEQAALQTGADSVCNSYCVDGHSKTV